MTPLHWIVTAFLAERRYAADHILACKEIVANFAMIVGGQGNVQYMGLK